MTRHVSPLFLSVLLLLIALSPIRSANGQEYPDNFDLSVYATETRVTIDFAGGPVSDFVDLIKYQAKLLNVMIRSDIQNVELPPLQLRNITLDTALNSLDQLSLGAIGTEMNDNREYYIIGHNMQRFPELVEVLNVGSFIFDYKPDGTGEVSAEKQKRLMSAIEAGQHMLASGSGTMRISLHENTGLLFVKGNPDETLLVKRIVQELAIPQGRNSGPAPGGFGGSESAK